MTDNNDDLELHCEHCGHTFDTVAAETAIDSGLCPECGGCPWGDNEECAQ